MSRTASHQHFLTRYAAALPADVTVTSAGNVTAYRIAGTKLSVQAEINRVTDGLPINRYWFIGPTLWGEEWVAHGEVRHPL